MFATQHRRGGNFLSLSPSRACARSLTYTHDLYLTEFLLCRLSRELSHDKALDGVQLFMQDEAAAARCFEAQYPGADQEVLRSVIAGTVFMYM